MKLQRIEFEPSKSNEKMGTYNIIVNDAIVATINVCNSREHNNEVAQTEYIASTYDSTIKRRENYIGRFQTLIEARVKVMRHLADNPPQKTTAKPEYLLKDGNNEFYPTPDKIAGMMLSGIDWMYVKTVLEPTAGKGDLANCAKKAASKSNRRSINYSHIDIDCIEIDSNLRHILKGEGYRVVHDDFLTFDGKKRYDLILMNPPFSNGDKHLLKALDLQKHGGSVVCLLNAETLKNPYTNTRKLLVDKLQNLGAKITYVKDGFSNAQRKTDVEIAIVKAYIPKEVVESDIYERMRKAEKYFDDDVEATDVCVTDLFQNMVSHFNVEVNASLELIRQYKALEPYILSSMINTKYAGHILELTVHSSGQLDTNECIKSIRMKYWNGLLNNNKVTGRLTIAERDKYFRMVSELGDYDFTLYNIEQIITQMNSEIIAGIKKAIMCVFETLTAQHTYNPECSKNIHYFNGWRTNKAYKVGKKVILPVWGVFSKWNGQPEVHTAYEKLGDIEKVFNYLNGKVKDEDRLWHTLERAFDRGCTKNIECKYFDVTFYKKGTVHIVFRDEKDVELLNIYAARDKNWLPPSYGKKHYKDMDVEEKAVVDEFQGESEYQKVMSNPQAYIFDVSTNSMLLLSA